MSNFSRLFNPRGVAIVGATEDAGRAGGQALQAISHHGYAGGIFPVNPNYDVIGEHRCFHSVADIAEPCDLSVIAVPARHVPGVIEQCGDRDISFAARPQAGTGLGGNSKRWLWQQHGDPKRRARCGLSTCRSERQ